MAPSSCMWSNMCEKHFKSETTMKALRIRTSWNEGRQHELTKSPGSRGTSPRLLETAMYRRPAERERGRKRREALRQFSHQLPTIERLNSLRSSSFPPSGDMRVQVWSPSRVSGDLVWPKWGVRERREPETEVDVHRSRRPG